METSEIKSRIKGIVAGMFDVLPENISDEKSFTEMAKYDSMRALEFLAKLENEFNVIIDPDQLPHMGTVDKTTVVIQGMPGAK
jgi:acyl carrier protein